MTVNKEALQKTIDLMKAHAEVVEGIGFDMSMYVHRGECGTSCCLAGFAYMAQIGSEPEVNFGIHTKAMDYLGLDPQGAVELFLPKGNGYYDAKFDQGIAVLEHLRDTGKVDWSVSGLPFERAEIAASEEVNS